MLCSSLYIRFIEKIVGIVTLLVILLSSSQAASALLDDGASSSITWTALHHQPDGWIHTQIEHVLPPNWHTYWKYPGDSGAPATLSDPSPHVVLGDLAFPEPVIIMEGDIVTYGYHDRVTYTLPIRIPPDSRSVTARFKWLECHTVCVPKSRVISLTLGTIAHITPPVVSPPPIQVSQSGSTVYFDLPPSVTRAAFFPYESGEFKPSSGTIREHQLVVPRRHSRPSVIKGELFLNGNPPIVIHDTPVVISSSIMAVIRTLLGAFLGGLILNIMPCVLPILGIKSLQWQQRPLTHPTRDAGFYWLGVSSMLLALYGALLWLKQIGVVVGWGFQLQSPITIQLLIGLFVLIIGINLDIIRLPVPGWVQQTHHHPLASGMLTTILGTSCTAPFLGSALAVALFQSPIMGATTFLAMGTGLALPMMLMMCRPSWRQWLPRSGHWNSRLKFGLNFGFILTIAWLASVLAQQLDRVVYGVFIGTLIGILSISHYRSPLPSRRSWLVIGLIAVASLAPLILHRSPSSPWIPYSPTLIQTMQRNQQPYLIDVTATWCITCQVNKQTVLNRANTLTYLEERQIQRIRADWTRHDPAITDLLHQFNQASIPTYIYFNGTDHVVFGDVLTFKKLKKYVE